MAIKLWVPRALLPDNTQPGDEFFETNCGCLEACVVNGTEIIVCEHSDQDQGYGVAELCSGGVHASHHH